MNRLEKVAKEVEKFYLANNPGADGWISYGYPKHVLVVAENTRKLAEAKGANVELAVAGALLHDIADSITERSAEGHEEKSLEMAKEIMKTCGFKDEEVAFVAKEIIGPHSCTEKIPVTLEGKVMATADAMAHFQTDFYVYFCWKNWGNTGKGDAYENFKIWVLKKIEKDFTKKIFFDDIREQMRPLYNALKLVFSQ